jgi:hypothetical protein
LFFLFVRCIRAARGSQFLTPIVNLNPFYLFKHLDKEKTTFITTSVDEGVDLLEISDIPEDHVRA